jgi:hypothetical protein
MWSYDWIKIQLETEKITERETKSLKLDQIAKNIKARVESGQNLELEELKVAIET